MRRAVIALLISGTLIAATPANQPRSRVSRVRSDMRSLTTAIEAYFIDNNAYPPTSQLEGQPLEIHWLTTPLAYLNEAQSAIDPFKERLERRAANRWEAMLAKGGSDWLWPLWGSVAVFIVMSLVAIAAEERRRGPRAVLVGAGRALIWAALALILLAGIVVVAKYSNASLVYSVPNTRWTEDWVVLSYHTADHRWVLQSVGPDGTLDLADISTVPLASREATEATLLPLTYDPTNGLTSSGDVFRVAQ